MKEDGLLEEFLISPSIKGGEAGTQTEFTWCALCRALSGLSRPLGYELLWQRDLDDDLTGFTDSRSNKTQYINGAAVVAYTWGTDGLIAMHDLDAEETFWYSFGPQGETRAITDENGAVVATYLYDAYGIELSSTGNINNPFRYGGRFGY